MNRYLELSEEVEAALAADRPVVALESTAIAHGLPRPRNIETAQAMEAAVRATASVPATVALIDGRVKVGLDADELERLGTSDDVAKVSRRDFGPVLASGGLGATTVAGTLVIARAAGIALFGTGGIGGVHRGGPQSFDISADLMELGRQPVAVVASGAKSILDLPLTLEVLETQGVPVIGYGQDDFPAFYRRSSGLAAGARVDDPSEAARVLQAHWGLGLESGLLIANPLPAEFELPAAALDAWTAQASGEAAEQGVAGKAVTPFLLRRLFELSDGATLEANIALLIANAGLAGAIAHAYHQDKRG